MTPEQLQAIKERNQQLLDDGIVLFRQDIEKSTALIAEVERLTEETLKQKADKMHLIVDKDYEKSQKQEYIKTVHILNEENKRLRALIEELAGDTAEHTAQVLRKTRQVRKGESDD